MKGKARACQEKIVHRVQIVAAQRGQNEYEKEKEEQRDGAEIADPSRQRTRLQLLRHLQGDVESGHQILIIPLQLPAVRRPPFFGRRKRIVREIETGKIRFHQQVEVARLRSAERHSQRLVVQQQLYVVVHRLLRGKRQLKHELFFP